MRRSPAILLAIIMVVGLTGPFFYCQALTASVPPAITIYDGQTLQKEGEWLPFDAGYRDEFYFSATPSGGPKDYIIVGAGSGNEPWVKVFTADGILIKKFLAYDKSFKGGVRVSGGDLDNDGHGEVITVPGQYGAAEVRIFAIDGTPKFTKGFLVFPKEYNQGSTLAVADFNKDGKKEIAVSRVHASPAAEVKVYSRDGQDLKIGFSQKEYSSSLGLNLAAIDLGGDGQAELIVNGGYGLGPEIDLRQIDGPDIGSWPVFDKNFIGGVNLAAGDIYRDGHKQIVVGAGLTGGPHVKVLDSYGKPLGDFFAGPADFGGGVKVALAQLDKDPQLEIITAPDRIVQSESFLGRKIKVDVGSAQTLFAYDGGFPIRNFLISSGRGGTKTVLGDFSIWRARPDVHMSGPGYDLPHIPWVLSFFGGYDIHGTYWHNKFGQPMSHGCVNMTIPDSKWIYDWVSIGTPVETYKN